MSKRADRKNRQREKIRAGVRNAAFAAAVGIVFLVLGIVGLILNGAEYRAWRDAEEKTSAEAEIVAVNPKTLKDSEGNVESVWDVKLRYTAGGTEYTGKTRLHHAVKQGDTETVDVYRTPRGDYRMPEITSERGLLAENLIPLISVAVGAFLTLAGAVLLTGDLRELRRLKS